MANVSSLFATPLECQPGDWQKFLLLGLELHSVMLLPNLHLLAKDFTCCLAFCFGLAAVRHVVALTNRM